MVDLSQYQQSAMDWREQLRRNNAKTRQVVAIFIIIYVGLGLLCDVFLYSSSYPQASLSVIFKALITLKLFPYATLTMGAVTIISLFITYALYDRIMLMGTEYHEVTQDSTDYQEKQLYHVVEELTIAAGIKYIPKIYIIEANYMNAFATGYSERSALVAITRGLMEKLTRDEIQAVMAHELSHIRHGDIKLTLSVGILSNIMLIVLDILFYAAVFGSRSRDEEGNGNRLFMIILLLRYLLPIITVILTLYISRKRELMADAGCVELMRDNSPLARALLKISQDHDANADDYRQEYGQTAHEEVRRAAYLFDPVMAGIEPAQDISSFFSTHPSIQERLTALGFKQKR